MGYYLNPRDQTKEDWLAVHGVEVPSLMPFEAVASCGSLPVILVDNGHFTAAGVVMDARDQTYMACNSSDKRPMRYFYVPVKDLKKVGAIPADWSYGRQ